MDNQTKAEEVTKILNDMEAAGEFAGLTPDEKETQKQVLGMRIRTGMM